MKIYQDSKELPLFNFERILETDDFYYMIKGYDGADLDAEEQDESLKNTLKEKFNDIVRDYVTSINSKNQDLIHLGNIEVAKINLMKYSLLYELICLKETENEARKIVGLEENWEEIALIFKNIKIRRSEDIREQKDYILERIHMWKNNLAKAVKLHKTAQKDPTEQNNINDAIVGVEIILERSIDTQKTSLYRFGKLQEIAIKKVESHNYKNKSHE